MELKKLVELPGIMTAKTQTRKSIVTLLLALAVGMACCMQLQAQQQGNPKMLTDNNIAKGDLSNGFQAAALQKILSVDLQNVTLEQGLKTIARKAGLKLVYSKNIIPGGKQVSLQKSTTTLENTLWALLAGTNLRFGVSSSNHLVIMKRTKKDKKTAQQARQETITGTVNDAQTGETLPGVNILVKGTSTGTSTNANGDYELTVESLQDTLVFSFIGYQQQSVPINGRTQIDIEMQSQVFTGEEMVVVGYGEQKKVNLTGSVSEVDGTELEQRTVNNIDQALQGLAPGLNVAPSGTYGGEPGAERDVNIRGIGSLSGGSPYVLVDGVPMDINNVNPNDVESISVLKDAASSAIYGARAPYGVILITTKSGNRDGEVEANYSSSFSGSTPITLPESLNSIPFSKAINQAGINSGQDPLFSDATIERMRRYQGDPENFPSMIPNPTDPNGWGYWNLANGNTDWEDVIYKDLALSQKHNLGISGGSENATYYVGLGWLNQGGKLNFADDKYERYNLNTNIEFDVTDWMQVSVNAKYSRNYNSYPQTLTGNREFTFNYITRQWPNIPVYTPNGDLAMDLSLAAPLAKGGEKEQYQTDLWLKPSLELNLSDNWIINTDLSYNSNSGKWNDYRAHITGLAVDGVTEVDHYSMDFSSMNQRLTNSEYFSTNIISTFEEKIDAHSFSVMVGGQAELSKYEMVDGWRRDLVTEEVPAISIATGDYTVDDAISHWSTLGAFARITYNFDEKYLFELNGRYDGSSRFEEGRRWGVFPSISAGYNISEEVFWNPVENIVNNLKLRASYGSLGNQNVANYLYVETIPIHTNLSWIMPNGTRPVYTSAPANTSTGLTWETSNTFNLGVDAGLLDNQLSFTFDWYIRKTEDMFGPGEPVPAILGTDVPQENNATLETKGFELTINWRQIINNNINYNIKLMLSDNKSTVTQYNNPTGYIYGFYEGKTYGDIWGYESAGLFQSDQEADQWADQSQLYSEWRAGDVKYKDLDNDGRITRGDETLNNHGDLKVIGNHTPRYLFGIDASLDFKRFDFRMFWQGVAKRDVWIGNRSFWGVMTAFPNSSFRKHNIDFWTTENSNAYFPKPYLTAENQKNQQVQSRYLQDASYLRLKNIQLGYTLPASISGKMLMKEARLYISGENIFTLTGMMDSFDPEETRGMMTSGGRVYPLSKRYSIGISIKF